jgi:hypothetical protein
MVQIADSAYPLAAGSYPSSVVGWGFYIGGDTPHVWSDAEVAALPYRYRLPIFTRSDPDGAAQAQSDAGAAVAWAKAHGQPAGTLIQLDFETAVNAVYVTAFDAIIVAGGYKTVLYGSQSTVQQNPTPSGGFNIANWDGVDDDPGWTAKQYEDTGDYDLNDFSPSAPLWDMQAKAAPAVATTVQEDDMLIIYVEGTTSVFLLSGGVLHGIQDPTSLAAYQAAGVAQVRSVTSAELTALQRDFAPLVTDLEPAQGVLSGESYQLVPTGTITLTATPATTPTAAAAKPAS